MIGATGWGEGTGGHADTTAQTINQWLTEL
ncbi:hypothetical protein HNP84_007224 [Thermocatellispora tengchongensis]|uniref:Flavodoxin n=1 Tax=Thermocatellispora tengchongensis TaxID=1073253 RepID=A0A840PE65_9ACTN|nr:hypothetical protein [Thermocatellispora tengchongensis]